MGKNKHTAAKDFTGHEHVGDILSFGGGVQSSAMLYMMHCGVLPKPLAVIHADTGDELYATADHLKYCADLCKDMDVPFITCGDGPIYRSMYAWREGRPYADSKIAGTMPVYVENGEGKRRGQLRRQCTDYHKVTPTQVAVKGLMLLNGWARPQKKMNFYRFVEISEWFKGKFEITLKDYYAARQGNPRVIVDKKYIRMGFGITTDEAYRASERGLLWQKTWYPLIEMGMSREDCIQWINEHGYKVPPKSACVECPYHSDPAWLNMYEAHKMLVEMAVERRALDIRAGRLPESAPEVDEESIVSDWNKACRVDELLRDQRFLFNNPFYGQIKGKMYLHESCKSLREIGPLLTDMIAAKPMTKRGARGNRLETALKTEMLDTCRTDGAFSCFS